LDPDLSVAVKIHLRLALIIEIDGLLAASGWVGNVQLLTSEKRKKKIHQYRILKENKLMVAVGGGC
jgi:hypothetical protein